MTMSRPEYWSALKSAHSEVGYLEKKSNSKLDDKTANAGYRNWTKYPKKIWEAAKKQKCTKYVKEIDYGAAWCDCFHDYNVLVASGNSVKDAASALCGRLDDYTPSSVELYKKEGRWGTKPMLGAQIFFGDGDYPTHTGHVYAYGTTAVRTIEGNTSGSAGVVANGGGVFRKSYDIDYKRIVGYGYPKWVKEPPKLGRYKALKQLNVRADTKATASKLASAAVGKALNITALRVNSAGNTWGYANNLGGWVCLFNKGKANAVHA